MSRKITRNSTVPFGRPGNKGRKISQQPDAFLQWMSEKLWDTDKHLWALAAREELESRRELKAEIQSEQELEEAADAFLKKHRIDPETLESL